MLMHTLVVLFCYSCGFFLLYDVCTLTWIEPVCKLCSCIYTCSFVLLFMLILPSV